MGSFNLQFFGSGGSPTQSRNLNTRQVPDILNEEALQNFDPAQWQNVSQQQYNPTSQFDATLANLGLQDNNALSTLEQFDANTQEALLPQQTMQNYNQPVRNYRQPQDILNDAADLTFKWEGGYVNDPADSGGETKYGITKATFERAKNAGLTRSPNVRSLTMEDARKIYNELYYKEKHADQLPPAIAGAFVDTAFNGGPEVLQRAVNRFVGQNILKEDGKIGPQTINAVNSLITDDDKLHRFLNIFHDVRAERFNGIVKKKPYKKKFLKGWLRRNEDFRNWANSQTLGNSQTQYPQQQQVPQVTPTDSDMNIDFSQDIPQAPTQNYYQNYFDYINSPEYFQRQKQQWGGI